MFEKYKTEDLAEIINRTSNRLALGYESDLDFCYGMITGWHVFKIIDKKQYNELVKNFANHDFDEEYDDIEKKYGRILAK